MKKADFDKLNAQEHSTSCMKRLHREWKELQANPIQNISAVPLEKNFFEWHVNMSPFNSEFDGSAFHLIISFPPNYPNEAPEVHACSLIDHLNVFEIDGHFHICLDVLTMSSAMKGTPYQGWTTAYTVSSLLIQLQSFLFDLDLCHPVSTRHMISQSLKFKCKGCGHTGRNHYPEIKSSYSPGVYRTLRKTVVREQSSLGSKFVQSLEPGTVVDVTEVLLNRALIKNVGWCSFITRNGPLLQNVSVDAKHCRMGINFINEVHDVLAVEIAMFLDNDTIHALKVANKPFAKACERTRELTYRSLKCFYTQKNLEADRDMILGIGVITTYGDKISRKTGLKTNRLQNILPTSDTLSYEAFEEERIRYTIWKDANFDTFLPIYIDSQHGKKSLPLAEKIILQLWKKENPGIQFKPVLCLDTISKMMNTTVVSIMKDVEELEAGEIKLHDSIRILKTYMMLYHLLLAFIEKYPQIVKIANDRVSRFIASPSQRDKERTPDVGELLVTVAISDYSWDDIKQTYIDEVFQREARWICQKYPNLLKLEKRDKISCLRMTQSFKATRTGKRLASFQRFFMTHIACPKEFEHKSNRLKLMLKYFNERYGQPDDSLAIDLQRHSRQVLAANDWRSYFKLIDYPCPSALQLCNWLRNSIRRSDLRAYHHKAKVLKHESNHWEKPSCRLAQNDLNCMCAGGKIFSISDKKKHECTLVKEPAKNLDLAFLIDCTGSMGSWIKSAKKNMLTIVSKITKKAKAEVRFGVVAYRDHKDAWLTKSFPLTSSVKKIKNDISSLSAAGGGDWPEAIGDGLVACNNLLWKKENTTKIVVLIADAPPHGFVEHGDDYPNGSPNRNADPFRICHTFKEKGIRLYSVFCGYDDAETEKCFEALSGITDGLCVSLRNAQTLPDIVIRAAMEEKWLENLGRKVIKEYETVLEEDKGRIVSSTFEQKVYRITAALRKRKVKSVSCIPRAQRSHVVKRLMQCGDMPHAKEVRKRHTMQVGKRTVLKTTVALITKDDVRRILNRIEDKLLEREFFKYGCCYRRDFYEPENANDRALQFEKASGLTCLQPWKKMDSAEKDSLKNSAFAADFEEKEQVEAVQEEVQKTAIKASTTKFQGWEKLQELRKAPKKVSPGPIAPPVRRKPVSSVSPPQSVISLETKSQNSTVPSMADGESCGENSEKTVAMEFSVGDYVEAKHSDGYWYTVIVTTIIKNKYVVKDSEMSWKVNEFAIRNIGKEAKKQVYNGVVTCYFPEKRFGFVRCDHQRFQDDLYFNIKQVTNIDGGFQAPEKGFICSFSLGKPVKEKVAPWEKQKKKSENVWDAKANMRKIKLKEKQEEREQNYLVNVSMKPPVDFKKEKKLLGRVSFYDVNKGFGFIGVNEEKIFFHKNSILKEVGKIIGATAKYVIENKQGKKKAIQIELIADTNQITVSNIPSKVKENQIKKIFEKKRFHVKSIKLTRISRTFQTMSVQFMSKNAVKAVLGMTWKIGFSTLKLRKS